MASTQRKKTVFINTLGCPKNEVDGEILAAHLIGAGLTIVDAPEKAAAEIVNTCGFISQAKSESIEAIFDAVFRRKKLGGRIVVTGCLAQRYGKELCEQIPQTDAVIGLQRPDLVVRMLTGDVKREEKPICWIGSPSAQGSLDTEIRSFPNALTYGYIKVSDGCDNRCTYCVIPSIRGALRSRSIDIIEKEARRFVEAGANEIILVGQDTAAYGLDQGRSWLPKLLRRLNDIDGEFWIRMLYLHPAHLNKEIIEACASCEKVVPYMDVPLQHISDLVLQAMGRQVTRKHIESCLEAIRTQLPHATIRTTFLIGHPGETDEAFKELVEFVEDFEFDRMGMFAYSPEEGTKSFGRTDVPSPTVTDQRVEELAAVQESIAARRSERYVGSELRCLLETPSDIYDGMWEGRSISDAPQIDGAVFVTTNGRRQPGFADVVIEQADGYDLFGHIS